MHKAKILVGLAVMLGLMTASVTTASAWFEQAAGTTSGTGNIGFSTFEGGGATASCSKAPFVDEVVEVSKQANTKLSTHLLVKHIAWAECLAAGFKANVTGFEFQLKQYTKGQTKGILVNVVTGGTIEVPGICTITISNSAANQQLKELSGESTATGLKGKANVGGITDTVSGLCPGITGTSTATFKAENLTATNQKLV